MLDKLLQLLRGKSSNSQEPLTTETLGLIDQHLDRVQKLISQDKTMLSVMTSLREMCHMFAPMVRDKVLLSLQDGEMHGFAVSNEIYLVVTCLVCDETAVADYFSRAFPPGYLTGFLQGAMNTSDCTIARSRGSTVFANLVICINKNKGRMVVYIALLPQGDRNFCPQPVMPEELFSEEDRRRQLLRS